MDRSAIRSTMWIIVGLMAIATFGQSTASAFNEPVKTVRSKLALVTGYQPCTNPHPCGPAVRNDPVCGFSANGRGTMNFAKQPGLYAGSYVGFGATGLDAGCEGQTLCLTGVIRATFLCDPFGVCTYPDGFFSTPCCTVSNGKCIMRGGRASFSPLSGGAEILGCGLIRTTGSPLPTGPTFSCGILGH